LSRDCKLSIRYPNWAFQLDQGTINVYSLANLTVYTDSGDD